MAGVEDVPAIARIGLEPDAEIHRIGCGRPSDIAQIAGKYGQGASLLVKFGRAVDSVIVVAWPDK